MGGHCYSAWRRRLGCIPKVFDDYEPSEVDLMTVYLAAYGDGAADKRKRESRRR